MKSFWDGFEKKALMPTRTQEDVATGATSLIPFGTTIHQLVKESPESTGKEWLARIAGGTVGTLPGNALAAASRTMTGKGIGTLAAIAGMVGGEIVASRMMTGKHYDPKTGKLIETKKEVEKKK